MNTFDDILTGLNSLLQGGNGEVPAKPEGACLPTISQPEQLAGLPHDLCCASGMSELHGGALHPVDFHLPFGSHEDSFHSVSFASSPDAGGSCHHVTISSLGYVYQDGETEVGKVHDRNMYNKHGDWAGHVSADGVIYDAHDHQVGHVDACGLVHTPSGAVIYDAHGNMVNGAAYMLLVYLGGVN